MPPTNDHPELDNPFLSDQRLGGGYRAVLHAGGIAASTTVNVYPDATQSYLFLLTRQMCLVAGEGDLRVGARRVGWEMARLLLDESRDGDTTPEVSADDECHCGRDHALDAALTNEFVTLSQAGDLIGAVRLMRSAEEAVSPIVGEDILELRGVECVAVVAYALEAYAFGRIVAAMRGVTR